MKIISKNFNEIEVIFSLDETIYLNGTQIAKKFKKDIREWKRAKQTTDYIDALSDVENLHSDILIKTFFGGDVKKPQGTWIHRKLIIHFARWLSPKFAVWCDLQIEEILKSKTQENSQQPQPDQNIVNNIFALEKSFSNLRPSKASKVTMTEKLYQRLDLETCYLPKYTEEKLTRSLTYLLKKYEIKISTQKANLKLLEVGILEKMERDSACGKTKYFWSLTENGLKFGKNLISPKNERETQPHFFEDKFLELVELF